MLHKKIFYLMTAWLLEVGCYILNGTSWRDAFGEFWGCSVIDYIVVNKFSIEIVSNFKVGERIESDHLSASLSMVRKKEESYKGCKRKEKMLE